MTSQLQVLDEAFWDALRPPSTAPAWQWCEDNIVLPPTEGAFPGPYRTELTPMVRCVYDAAQNLRTRRLVMQLSAQSGKTLVALAILGWSVENDPATTMWVMASKDNCEEFLRKRLEPFFLYSPALARHWPTQREYRTLRLVQFPTMNMMPRGSNSRIGLQSDPVRRIICDERREWADGAIDLLRERLKTFHNSIEISMGTAGVEGDQLHRDWEEGSQTVFLWPCSHCGHEQPLRWGTKATPIWEDRKQGGIVWETSSTTKPGGEWNYEEVAKTVGYQCENPTCGYIYRNHEKFGLVRNMRAHHRRPEMLPEYPSFHWNELYMPWVNSAWDRLVIKFLKATHAMKRGEIAPLQTFITETCGEPWRPPSDAVDNAEIMQRRGRYKFGDPWPEDGPGRTAQLVTVDVQKDHLIVVVRAYRTGGVSRLMWCGKVRNYSDLYADLVKRGIPKQCVFVDPSYDRPTVMRECLRYGWHPLEGDEHERFTLPEPVKDPATGKMVRVQTPWTYKTVDPHIGTAEGGRQRIKVFLWSNPAYMERLYFYTLKGLAATWEIPLDIDTAEPTYIPQVMAYERQSKTDENGAVTYSWTFRGKRHDYADAELMQLAAADICSITKTETVAIPQS